MRVEDDFVIGRAREGETDGKVRGDRGVRGKRGKRSVGDNSMLKLYVVLDKCLPTQSLTQSRDRLLNIGVLRWREGALVRQEWKPLFLWLI